MTSAERDEILAFLHKNPMGVISTIHVKDGAPESALIAFAETPEFEIIFQTLNDARKYANLKNDPRISLVIGFETEKQYQITFQYEGLAKELDDDGEREKYRKVFEAKDTPCTSAFLDNPKSRLFVATPRWFAYSDYSKEAPRIIEVQP